MNSLSRHLRSSSLSSWIRGYGGIKSISRFSSQSDGFTGGRLGEQSPVPDASLTNSSLPNTGGDGDSASYAQNYQTFSQVKSGLRNIGGNSFSAFSTPSYQSFTQSTLLKDNNRSRGSSNDMDFVKGVLEEDEGRRIQMGISPFYRPNLETNADVIHIKMLRNNTFVTVTDSKGNVKCKVTSGSLPDRKGGRKLSADATAENIGRKAKALGLKSVVVKVNGFTHFKRKRQAILAFRDGFTNSRSDQNPIVYIEDTTRKAHNGCRLPKKRRI